MQTQKRFIIINYVENVSVLCDKNFFYNKTIRVFASVSFMLVVVSCCKYKRETICYIFLKINEKINPKYLSFTFLLPGAHGFWWVLLETKIYSKIPFFLLFHSCLLHCKTLKGRDYGLFIFPPMMVLAQCTVEFS